MQHDSKGFKQGSPSRECSMSGEGSLKCPICGADALWSFGYAGEEWAGEVYYSCHTCGYGSYHNVFNHRKNIPPTTNQSLRRFTQQVKTWNPCDPKHPVMAIWAPQEIEIHETKKRTIVSPVVKKKQLLWSRRDLPERQTLTYAQFTSALTTSRPAHSALVKIIQHPPKLVLLQTA